jgi:hypothetical protein
MLRLLEHCRYSLVSGFMLLQDWRLFNGTIKFLIQKLTKKCIAIFLLDNKKIIYRYIIKRLYFLWVMFKTLNLNSVNQLIFVMVTCGVLFEVRTEFLYIIYTSSLMMLPLKQGPSRRKDWCLTLSGYIDCFACLSSVVRQIPGYNWKGNTAPTPKSQRPSSKANPLGSTPRHTTNQNSFREVRIGWRVNVPASGNGPGLNMSCPSAKAANSVTALRLPFPLPAMRLVRRNGLI